jgi:hypothetical protein
MKKTPAGRSGFLQIRAVGALLLFGVGICVAKFSFAPPQFVKSERDRREVDRPRYMPVPGRERGDAEELTRMEEEWNTFRTQNRLYGSERFRFNRRWFAIRTRSSSSRSGRDRCRFDKRVCISPGPRLLRKRDN